MADGNAKRTQSQTRSAGPDRVKPVGDTILTGSGTWVGSKRGGKQQQGTQTYDRKAYTFRKLNNADPSAKNL